MSKEPVEKDDGPDEDLKLESIEDPKTLKVDPELQHLIPVHRKSEIALLERSILEVGGCYEPLLVWVQPGGYVLLDGHTRRDLCIKHKFQVRIHKIFLKGKEEAKAFVKKVQLGRRNTPEQTESYLRGSHYNELKQGHGGDRRSKGQADPLNEAEGKSKGQPDPLNEATAEKLAKEYEVSAKTIKRDGQFARLLDAVLKQASMEDKKWLLLGGDVKLNRGAVKKLSELKGKELKKHMEHLLKEGRLPRKERAKEAASPKATVKTQAKSFVEKLKARDEELPVKMLNEMATLLGFTLTPKKK